jgi:hypothetical protein
LEEKGLTPSHAGSEITLIELQERIKGTGKLRFRPGDGLEKTVGVTS